MNTWKPIDLVAAEAAHLREVMQAAADGELERYDGEIYFVDDHQPIAETVAELHRDGLLDFDTLQVTDVGREWLEEVAAA